MRAKFEEKTFESYFNNELNARSSIYFPLGQVQEGVMGMDSAAYSSNWRLWRKLGYPFWIFPPFIGVDLKYIADEMEALLGEVVRDIPTMKVNLLFQYKRPEYMPSRLCKEWVFWGQPYFRYKLYKEQHDLLAHLEKILKNRALILYAAPAIANINDLVALNKRRKIIDSTNFKKASELTGHHVNTYIQAGTYSQACSEPEKIENFDLLNFLEKQSENNEISNEIFIVNFSKAVISAFLESAPLYKAPYEALLEDYREIEQHPLLISMVKMKLFRDLTGIQWLISI